MISELFQYLYMKGKIMKSSQSYPTDQSRARLLLIFNLEDRKEHQTIWPISFK